MELANLWPRQQGSSDNVRLATKADAGAILRLLQTAVYTHLHVDWQLPGDWIGSPGFVVLPKVRPEEKPKKSITNIFFQEDRNLVGCLAAAPDPLPAAWVRAAAIDDPASAEKILAMMFARVVPSLRRQGVEQLAWLAVEEWPQPWLPSLGFAQVSEIETFIKEDRLLPSMPHLPQLTIRQVFDTDFAALELLEAAAFAPLWRQSARTLAIARRQSLSFDVALLADEVVGYQLSAPSENGAHLVRLTVHPERHGAGIGSALLGHALRNFHQRRIYKISLNTQVENISSQKLYMKFGFNPSGQRLPIWSMAIT